MRNRPVHLVAAAALLGSVTACGAEASYTNVDITAHDNACTVNRQQVPTGHVTFHVKNATNSPATVSIYTENGNGHFTVLTARQSGLAPNATATVSRKLDQGQYGIRCSPSSGTGGVTFMRAAEVQGGAGGPTHPYSRAYQFQVSSSGSVSATPNMTARAGQEVHLTVYNHSGTSYRLTLTNPQGEQAVALVAAPKQMGQTNVVLVNPGRFQVRVYAAGKQAQAQTFPLTVNK